MSRPWPYSYRSWPWHLVIGLACPWPWHLVIIRSDVLLIYRTAIEQRNHQ